MLEYWNNGFWPPARRSYASERMMQCRNNGPATGGNDDIIKLSNILLKNQYSIVPLFHYSIFGANSEVPKNLDILS